VKSIFSTSAVSAKKKMADPQDFSDVHSHSHDHGHGAHAVVHHDKNFNEQ
jgi:hypothetical protein